MKPPLLQIAVEMKDLLRSPSSHKQPLRPGRGEPSCLSQLLNHAGLLCVHAGEAARAQCGPAECYLSLFSSFDSNVPVGVLWSDVPTPGRLQGFHRGPGAAESFIGTGYNCGSSLFKKRTLSYIISFFDTLC